MDHNVWSEWNNISNQKISPDGKWITYTTSSHFGDPRLHLYEVSTAKDYSFYRAHDAKLSFDQSNLIFRIKPSAKVVRELKRNKVKKKDMPKDTLGIYNIASKKLTKIPHLESFKVPEEGALAFAYQIINPDKKKKEKAFDLIIHHLKTNQKDTIPNTTKYAFNKYGNSLAAINLKKDSAIIDGVWIYNIKDKTKSKILEQTGKYSNLAWDESGNNLAFLADLDTSKIQVRPIKLMICESNQSSRAEILADRESRFLPKEYSISKNYNPQFSKNGKQLYFGIAPYPILKDTSLLEDEIVNVEVWASSDELLYTQQEARLEREKKKTYRTVYNFESGSFIRIQDENTPDLSWANDATERKFALVQNPKPYQKAGSWEGTSMVDMYLVELKTGIRKLIRKNTSSNARLSPDEKFVLWYESSDTVWYSYDIYKEKLVQLTNNDLGTFYDEINDRPMHPRSNSSAGWLENESSILLYDRYDIWAADPTGNTRPKRLTKGRENQRVYRYVRLDPEEKHIRSGEDIILSIFNEIDKSSGYVRYNINTNSTTPLLEGDYRFNRIQKAKNGNQLIFTRESFRDFPDLYTTDLDMQKIVKVSDANPQQAAYAWGDIELYNWVSSDGIELEGLLLKPDNFDPSKKYPLMVNFYEKSSNGLNRYPTISPGRSSINYAYYVNQGYVVFNPNIPYKIGWPGESAYNAVISGVTALINDGFINKEKIGVQGHSWGGYQIAHLITRSNIFACAEAGAPVVNMFSAYGGIRWGSGMSRMFQYEHTQSRIGGPIWDKLIRYIDNSPLFYLDKIETPVLMMHNDEDTAVPWYQGIEFFVSLRRLNKPAWLLNYNGEPHGLTKWENKVDFQRRMSQFFDYYLLDKPQPLWMKRGVPAIEKSIRQGYESVEADKN